jgi:hypothetical protein
MNHIIVPITMPLAPATTSLRFMLTICLIHLAFWFSASPACGQALEKLGNKKGENFQAV